MPVEGETIEDSRSAMLQSLEKQLLKQHIVLDAQSRPQFIFECPVNTPDNGPCLATEYVYINGTESIVKSRQEQHYRWKAAWDSNFTFDQNANYDPDGDGSI